MADHQDFQNMNEQQIFTEIGRALLGETLGTTRLNDAEAEEAGRAWFKSVLPIIRERICGNEQIRKQLMSPEAQLRNAALAVVLDTLLRGLFKDIQVAAISQAVLCYGLHVLCGAEQAR
jgi:hypothetical protein